MTDTIFALSSGTPPAAIAVVRVSGPEARAALTALAGKLPPPRRAVAAHLRRSDGALLDHALVLWLPGPATATGEDSVELHCHGGRAVVAAVEAALGAMRGLRRAQAGEFTRRAFANGRIDLAEAEGLGDLLSAETEVQRAAALAMADGAVSRETEAWRDRLLGLSAQVEAVLDFSDEDDTSDLPDEFARSCAELSDDIGQWLDRPRAEPLRDGFRIVLAGPPNAGKSTLFNTLTESEAAITSPIPGTTRDVITRAVALEGLPFVFVDTAGQRDEGADTIEQVGIARARAATELADLVLWLGPGGPSSETPAWRIAAQIDRPDRRPAEDAEFAVSALSGEGMAELRGALIGFARQAVPRPGEPAINQRQRECLSDAHMALNEAGGLSDPLLVAECLRRTRVTLDRLVGRTGTEDMLDALFGRFCIGK